MTFKPIRVFSGDYGDKSIDNAGPDILEADLDAINVMFDPEDTHEDDSPGGIGTGNMQANAVTDVIFGDRTINQEIAEVAINTGKMETLLSFIARSIKRISGETDWKAIPVITLKAVVEAFGLHAQNKENPHEVTAQQLGVPTNEELLPYLSTGDTVINIEAFVIINPDLGNGTFTYKDKDENIQTGIVIYDTDLVTPLWLRFALQTGSYRVGSNYISFYRNDTLFRSQASGGLQELGSDGNESSLVQVEPMIADTEVTFVYYQRIGLAGKHGVLTHSPNALDEVIHLSESAPEFPVPYHTWFQILQ